jgi:hypothetical protein
MCSSHYLRAIVVLGAKTIFSAEACSQRARHDATIGHQAFAAWASFAAVATSNIGKTVTLLDFFCWSTIVVESIDSVICKRHHSDAAFRWKSHLRQM